MKKLILLFVIPVLTLGLACSDSKKNDEDNVEFSTLEMSVGDGSAVLQVYITAEDGCLLGYELH